MHALERVSIRVGEENRAEKRVFLQLKTLCAHKTHIFLCRRESPRPGEWTGGDKKCILFAQSLEKGGCTPWRGAVSG